MLRTWLAVAVSIGLTASVARAHEPGADATAQRVQVQEDKETLIDKVIPGAIKTILKETGAVISLFNSVKGAIDFVAGLGEALGILNPSDGPNISMLFADLNNRLNEVAGELDWKIGATARDARYGDAMAAFFELMHASQVGEVKNEILGHADDNSLSVLHEIMGPDASAFMRLYRPEVTSGFWEQAVKRRPEVSNGAVYDWRLGIPELTQYLAIRVHVIAALDPEFRQNGEFRSELVTYRDFVQMHIDKIQGGEECWQTIQRLDPDTRAKVYWRTNQCVDIYTGEVGNYYTEDPDDPHGEDYAREDLHGSVLSSLRDVVRTLSTLADPQ
jgi:hypothetical protein